MNLLGLRNLGSDGKLTLDKINAKMRAVIKNQNISLKIIQSNSENKAVSCLHKYRKKIDHIIISPETWNQNGYLIRDTLALIKIPFSIIIDKKINESIFESTTDSSYVYYDANYVDAYLESIKKLDNIL